jgi:hypothetical protein
MGLGMIHLIQSLLRTWYLICLANSILDTRDQAPHTLVVLSTYIKVCFMLETSCIHPQSRAVHRHAYFKMVLLCTEVYRIEPGNSLIGYTVMKKALTRHVQSLYKLYVSSSQTYLSYPSLLYYNAILEVFSQMSLLWWTEKTEGNRCFRRNISQWWRMLDWWLVRCITGRSFGGSAWWSNIIHHAPPYP